jgi:hypothetical protein
MLRFCITQRGHKGWPADRALTFQAGITMPLWPITRVKNFGPGFPTYEEASAYVRKVRPRNP